MPCSRSDAILGVPASFSPGAVLIKAFSVRVHIGVLTEEHSGSLLSGGDTHTAWLHDLANIIISRRHSRWCPAYDESSNQNRHHWTPLKWISSISGSPSDWAAHQWSDISSCGPLVAGPQCRTSLWCDQRQECQDEQQRSSASEVGTDDRIATTTKSKNNMTVINTDCIAWCCGQLVMINYSVYSHVLLKITVSYVFKFKLRVPFVHLHLHTHTHIHLSLIHIWRCRRWP